MVDINLFPDGLYDDLKRLAAKAMSPLTAPVGRWRRRRAELARFSTAFSSHPATTTDFVDYFRWHEQDEDWRKSNGLLCAATFGELLHMWAVPDVFVPYEAKLLRFLGRGGASRRIFVIGGDLIDPVRRWALYRALERHEILGFDTRIRSTLDLRAATRDLGVNCEMFGVLNRRVAYFLNVESQDEPTMLRTVDDTTVTRTENRFGVLWKGAEESSKWRRNQPFPPPDEVHRQAEQDAAAVVAVADQPMIPLGL